MRRTAVCWRSVFFVFVFGWGEGLIKRRRPQAQNCNTKSTQNRRGAEERSSTYNIYINVFRCVCTIRCAHYTSHGVNDLFLCEILGLMMTARWARLYYHQSAVGTIQTHIPPSTPYAVIVSARFVSVGFYYHTSTADTSSFFAGGSLMPVTWSPEFFL